jgi:hypothetical protein
VGLKYSWWPEATTPLDSAMHQKLQTITKPNTFLTANLIRWKHLQVLFAPNPNESMSIYIYIYGYGGGINQEDQAGKDHICV